MGHLRNTISDEEFNFRLSNIMPIFERREHNKEHIKEMFFLYNDRLTPRKTIMTCGKCVRYVYERLKQVYG